MHHAGAAVFPAGTLLIGTPSPRTWIAIARPVRTHSVWQCSTVTDVPDDTYERVRGMPGKRW